MKKQTTESIDYLIFYLTLLNVKVLICAYVYQWRLTRRVKVYACVWPLLPQNMEFVLNISYKAQWIRYTTFTRIRADNQRLLVIGGINKLSNIMLCGNNQTHINSLGPSDTIWRQAGILVNTGSCNGLVPSGTKPIPEPMLTRRGAVTITWAQEITSTINH